MIKILNVFQVLNNAGTEKVMYNLYSGMNRNRIKCDYLVEEKGSNEQIFRDLGSNIFYIPFTNEKEYLKKIIKFLNENKYDIMHVHSHNFKNMLIALKAAKICNIKVRILHVHGARLDLPLLFRLYKMKQEIQLTRYVTNLFACSSAAAKWNFPINYKKARIIYNGINLERFLYNEETRKKMRKRLGIDSKTKIVLNVGRLSKSKNQKKIIKIAKACKKDDINCRFYIAGEGELKGSLQEKIEKYKLQDRVILLGNINNVNDYLMASDIFLFPTQYEGLGVALIEAQSTGIWVLSSNRVPKEVELLNDTIELIPLNAKTKVWKNKLLNLVMLSNEKRIEKSKIAMKSCYNIQNISKELESIYISLLKKERDSE